MATEIHCWFDKSDDSYRLELPSQILDLSYEGLDSLIGRLSHFMTSQESYRCWAVDVFDNPEKGDN